MDRAGVLAVVACALVPVRADCAYVKGVRYKTTGMILFCTSETDPRIKHLIDSQNPLRRVSLANPICFWRKLQRSRSRLIKITLGERTAKVFRSRKCQS